MPVTPSRSQQLEAQRRAGYLVVCVVAAIMHLPLALRDTGRGDWRPALGVILSVFLVGVILSGRVSVRTIDRLLLWTADLGALIILAFTAMPQGQVGARESLIFVIFFVLWFGLMSFKKAFWRSVALYAAVIIIALTHPAPDYVALTYLGFVGLLTGLLSFASREVQRSAEETSHFEALALTDPLTGVGNRRSLYTKLQDIYASGTREEYSVLLMDVDHFKEINDSYGHDMGDEVLQQVAQVLQSCLGTGDALARWGGEEFLMLVHSADLQVLRARCGQIARSLAASQGMPGGMPRVTVSVGGARGTDENEVTGLLRTADRRMYQAKSTERGSACLIA